MTEVKFLRKHMEDVKQNTLQSIYMLQELKKAGIPVVGNIMFQGLRYGTLTITSNAEHCIFRWEDDEL
jgi:3-methyladenine DNA glycosylase Tag